MKERPILFSAPMVRAILAGTKTVTRRIVKPMAGVGGVPLIPLPTRRQSIYLHEALGLAWAPYSGSGMQPWPTERIGEASPYGGPVDRLWVRETHAPRYFDDGRPGYRADWSARAAECVPEPRWKPSIFMRRHDSRITLAVTGVRVERLQAITPADVRAEGITQEAVAAMLGKPVIADTPLRDLWQLAWDAINGKRAPWSTNPWVWRVEFQRVDDVKGQAA